MVLWDPDRRNQRVTLMPRISAYIRCRIPDGPDLLLKTRRYPGPQEMENPMLRIAAFIMLQIAILLAAVGPSRAGEYGTAEEAKAVLEKAVVAVKEDKAKALDMFNKGEGGFKDRDLYVFCANVSDGILTAHPYLKGEHLQDIKGKKGYPLGQEIMQNATEETIKELTYWWPRPGSDKPLEKVTFYTRVGDQDCGVGHYKD